MFTKGQTATDVLVVVLVLTAFAVGLIFANQILSEFNTDFQADSSFTADAKASLATLNNNFPTTFDSAFIIMLVLFWVLLIVTSIFIDTNPIFFVLVCVILIFIFVIGMVASNTYSEILSDSGELSTFSASFPMTHYVMSHLLIFIMVMGFSAAIALYAKSQRGGV